MLFFSSVSFIKTLPSSYWSLGVEGVGGRGDGEIDLRLRRMVLNESREFWRGGEGGKGVWEVFWWEEAEEFWFEVNDMLGLVGGFGLLRESRQYSVRKELKKRLS